MAKKTFTKTARELLAQWMIKNSFSTGHGDTLEGLLEELAWQVKELRGATSPATPTISGPAVKSGKPSDSPVTRDPVNGPDTSPAMPQRERETDWYVVAGQWHKGFEEVSEILARLKKQSGPLTDCSRGIIQTVQTSTDSPATVAGAAPEPTNWKGVKWRDSIKASNLAQKIALHFAHDCYDSMCGEDADASNCESAWVEDELSEWLDEMAAPDARLTTLLTGLRGLRDECHKNANIAASHAPMATWSGFQERLDTQVERICAGLARMLNEHVCAATDEPEATFAFDVWLREAELEDALRALQCVSEATVMNSYDAGKVIDAGYKEEAGAALARCEEKVKG